MSLLSVQVVEKSERVAGSFGLAIEVYFNLKPNSDRRGRLWRPKLQWIT